MSGSVRRLVNRAVNARENEIIALVWSCAYFFFILTAYYIIRPIRDEMGVAGGVENLAWLFTGTLVGMLILHPFYTWLVGRLPRRTFVPLTYRFFILNLVVFFFLFRAADPAQAVWIGRIFFIWTSVFNLFVVSVFWSFMTDVYSPEQSKRLFGMVAVGGTLGAVLGSTITTSLVTLLGPVALMLVSAGMLEVAAQASRVLDRHEGKLALTAAEENGSERDGKEHQAPPSTAGTGGEVIGGGVLEGIRHVIRSPYLLGIAGLMLFFTIASTFLYFQQAAITAEHFGDDGQSRLRLFANMDLTVNILTFVTQIFLTGRVLRWFGVGVALAFLPVVSLIGFGILATAPVLAVLVVFQVLRRAGNFAIQRPAREVLYTVLERTDKYKAKNFNDTFVYRLGDQMGAWSYTLAASLGMGIAALALMMVPLSFLWMLLALWLGRGFSRRNEVHREVGAPLPVAAAEQP